MGIEDCECKLSGVCIGTRDQIVIHDNIVIDQWHSISRSSDRNRMMFKRESVIIIIGHSRLSGSVIKAK